MEMLVIAYLIGFFLTGAIKGYLDHRDGKAFEIFNMGRAIVLWPLTLYGIIKRNPNM